jgi:hypothetical protein
MVHRLRDMSDLDQTGHREMATFDHQPHDAGKPAELIAFCRSQWVRLEKRNDADDKIIEGPDVVAVQVFPVVVVAAIAADTPTSEEQLQLVQYLHRPLALNHRELRLDLPAEATRGVPEDRNAEAALAVDEADDPLLESWPFLLIGRTERIVTAHCTPPYVQGVTVNEYRRIHGVSSI